MYFIINTVAIQKNKHNHKIIIHFRAMDPGIFWYYEK